MSTAPRSAGDDPWQRVVAYMAEHGWREVTAKSRDFEQSRFDHSPVEVDAFLQMAPILARPTWIPPDDTGSFYQEVIRPLLTLASVDDTLYGWLTLLFRFCSCSAVARFISSTPGPRLVGVPAHAGVSHLHLPLDTIAKAPRERHRTFRFLNLIRRQWEALVGGRDGEGEEAGE